MPRYLDSTQVFDATARNEFGLHTLPVEDRNYFEHCISITRETRINKLRRIALLLSIRSTQDRPVSPQRIREHIYSNLISLTSQNRGNADTCMRSTRRQVRIPRPCSHLIVVGNAVKGATLATNGYIILQLMAISQMHLRWQLFLLWCSTSSNYPRHG
jgi:hypothetical protein